MVGRHGSISPRRGESGSRPSSSRHGRHLTGRARRVGRRRRFDGPKERVQNRADCLPIRGVEMSVPTTGGECNPARGSGLRDTRQFGQTNPNPDYSDFGPSRLRGRPCVTPGTCATDKTHVNIFFTNIYRNCVSRRMRRSDTKPPQWRSAHGVAAFARAQSGFWRGAVDWAAGRAYSTGRKIRGPPRGSVPSAGPDIAGQAGAPRTVRQHDTGE